MTERRFPIRIGRRSRQFLRLAFGVTPERAYGAIDDERVWARFGRFEVGTPLSNVARWRIEGPWRWFTAIGVRMNLLHHDLSFAGSPRGGVRLDFTEPVHWHAFHLLALYVAVDDLEGFAAALAVRGIPGEDGRAKQGT
jgi:hypothetical protein